MPGVNIFISYRRDDAAGHAGRISDRLEERFPGCVFMDVTGLGPGAHFVRTLGQKLDTCHVLIVVIGKTWLSILRARDRQTDEPDYARIEVATALSKGIPVIPVLVQGAQMPARADLPKDLQALRDHQWLEITEPDFRSDVRRLIAAIEGLYPQQQQRREPDLRPKSAGVPLWLKLGLGLGIAAILGIVILAALINPLPDGDEVTNGGGVVPPPPPWQPANSGATAPGAFVPAGRWTVTRQDAQQWVFVMTLGPGGAEVQFPSSTQTGGWNYDEGQRTLTVRAPDGTVMLGLRVAEWHQDHFHGQWFTAGGAMGVNIRPG